LNELLGKGINGRERKGALRIKKTCPTAERRLIKSGEKGKGDRAKVLEIWTDALLNGGKGSSSGMDRGKFWVEIGKGSIGLCADVCKIGRGRVCGKGGTYFRVWTSRKKCLNLIFSTEGREGGVPGEKSAAAKTGGGEKQWHNRWEGEGEGKPGLTMGEKRTKKCVRGWGKLAA